jgi:hypothetical protein
MKHLLLCGLVGLVIAPFWTQVEARDSETSSRFRVDTDSFSLIFKVTGNRVYVEDTNSGLGEYGYIRFY